MQSEADNKLAPRNSIGRVDIGPLAGKVGYALRRAQLAVFDEIIAAFAELDLRPAQYSVLVLLEHARVETVRSGSSASASSARILLRFLTGSSAAGSPAAVPPPTTGAPTRSI